MFKSIILYTQIRKNGVGLKREMFLRVIQKTSFRHFSSYINFFFSVGITVHGLGETQNRRTKSVLDLYSLHGLCRFFELFTSY